MTPSDADVRINTTPDLFDEADEVHISCLFFWDRQRAEQLADLKPERMYFAYDTPDDRDPFIEAMLRLDRFGISRSSRYCYSLCGYRGDTFSAAERRMREIWQYGAMPFAMLYRDDKGEGSNEWKLFQRQFAKPQIARSILTNKTKVIIDENGDDR